jgi:chromosome segregation ATPase
VQALTADVNALGRQVAGMQVSVATLLEHARREESTAQGYRQGIRQEVQALRDEQQQVSMSVTGIQADVVKITRTLGEHETERQQVKGAATLAKSISGAGWGIVGLLAGGILTAVGFIAKHFAAGPPPTPGAHP